MNCKNCNAEVNSNFCHNCGHPTSVKRIDRYYIIREIGHLLHFERGLLYTIRALITNPGESIRTYLLETRSRLVKPVFFIIVTSLVYSLCNHYFHFDDNYVNYSGEEGSTTTELFKWVQEDYGNSNMVMAIFIALWTKLFFRKYNFNFFEILILLCFIMGIAMLIFSIFGAVQGITHVKTMQYAGIGGFAYTTFAIGQFYDKRKIASYVKAFLAYILGMVTFVLLLMIVGAIIDLINN